MRIILSLLILLLCSCSATERTVIVEQKKTPLTLEDPKPLALKEVSFVVITQENVDQVFKELSEQGIEPVVFALTGPDYKALAYNVEEIKTYLLLQKEIILMYRKYYE